MQVLVVAKNIRAELRTLSEGAFRVGLAIAGAKEPSEKLPNELSQHSRRPLEGINAG
jgi:hypothetical protein